LNAAQIKHHLDGRAHFRVFAGARKIQERPPGQLWGLSADDSGNSLALEVMAATVCQPQPFVNRQHLFGTLWHAIGAGIAEAPRALPPIWRNLRDFNGRSAW
jgi:hypothetical protein